MAVDVVGIDEACLRDEDARRVAMRTPDEVAAMLELKRRGWGCKRIARELGTCPKTVRRYLREGCWTGYARGQRTPVLAGLEAWLAERLARHAGNADVVRQELAAEHGITVSLRTVERACAPHRQLLLASALATVRFETRPGKQMQIDFGERRVWISGEPVRVHLFVATLGYSRRLHVRAFRSQAQERWFAGMESAFRAFGGVPEEILFDNARALVEHHDATTREVVFNARLHTFARHWRVQPRACAPYRARTKGKDERGVSYVKRNAIAGRSFASWAALEAHLEAWTREVADVRRHGTTGEAPMARFRREEAQALRPLAGTPPFRPLRALARRVQNDGCVDVDTNHYSVPWQLIGAEVSVEVGDGEVRIRHAGVAVARHAQRLGRHERAVMAAHLHGIARGAAATASADPAPPCATPLPGELLRPLAEYEQVTGGRW